MNVDRSFLLISQRLWTFLSLHEWVTKDSSAPANKSNNTGSLHNRNNLNNEINVYKWNSMYDDDALFWFPHAYVSIITTMQCTFDPYYCKSQLQYYMHMQQVTYYLQSFLINRTKHFLHLYKSILCVTPKLSLILIAYNTIYMLWKHGAPFIFTCTCNSQHIRHLIQRN